MNVSLEHKIVWLAPERCGTQITKKIFENYNFFSVDNKNTEKLKKFSDFPHSHENIIFEKFQNFKKIVNIRNPYDFVLSIYLNKFLKSPLTKNSVGVKENFNNWVLKSFMNHGYKVFICPFYNNPNSFFKKWTFDDEFTPDFVIKMESLNQDILNLPFINSDKELMKEKIQSLVSDNGFINKRYISFDELYEVKSAKLIYHYFKSVFYKFGYNPYSFTKEQLSNEQKISFIHGEIQ